MSTAFWISYIAEWALLGVVLLVVAGLAAYVHRLAGGVKSVSGLMGRPLFSEESDGPPLDSRVPVIEFESINDYGTVRTRDLPMSSQTLLIFLSGTCTGYQSTVGAVQRWVDQHPGTLSPVVVMRSNRESCKIFASVFEPTFPVICDEKETISGVMSVHIVPFGLLYGTDQRLKRKGVIQEWEQVCALMGQESAAIGPQDRAPAQAGRVANA